MAENMMAGAIKRGNLRLIPSEVRECEKMLEFVRAHPGCIRSEIRAYMRTSRINTYIQIGKVYG